MKKILSNFIVVLALFNLSSCYEEKVKYDGILAFHVIGIDNGGLNDKKTSQDTKSSSTLAVEMINLNEVEPLSLKVVEDTVSNEVNLETSLP